MDVYKPTLKTTTRSLCFKIHVIHRYPSELVFCAADNFPKVYTNYTATIMQNRTSLWGPAEQKPSSMGN